MPMPPTKLSLLKDAARGGDWKKALSIAAKFSDLGPQKAAIRRAHECSWNPDFFRQMGWNTEHIVAAGIAALKERYQI
jgi:hypothetical protein